MNCLFCDAALVAAATEASCDDCGEMGYQCVACDGAGDARPAHAGCRVRAKRARRGPAPSAAVASASTAAAAAAVIGDGDDDNGDEPSGGSSSRARGRGTRTGTRRSTRSGGSMSVSLSASARMATAAEVLLDASIGFEWECESCNFENEAGDRAASKVVIIAFDHGVNLESDSGHSEIVTAPIRHTGALLAAAGDEAFDTPFLAVDAQIAAIDACRRRVRALQAAAAAFRPHIVRTPAQQSRLAAWSTVDVSVAGAQFSRGTMQASMGVPLSRILQLATPETTWPALRPAVENAEVATLLERVRGLEGTDSLRGFILLVELYLIWLPQVAPRDHDGPKTACHMMMRTNFCAMLASLSGGERDAFAAYAGRRRDQEGTNKLFPRGYSLGAAGFIHQKYSLLVAEWLRSIYEPREAGQEYLDRITALAEGGGQDIDLADAENATSLAPRAAHDLLSPPPFYMPHAGAATFTYGMGLYGVVHGLVLFELRGAFDGGINIDNMGASMQTFAEFAFRGTVGAASSSSRRKKGRAAGGMHEFTVTCADGTQYRTGYAIGGGHCFYDSFARLTNAALGLDHAGVRAALLARRNAAADAAANAASAAAVLANAALGAAAAAAAGVAAATAARVPFAVGIARATGADDALAADITEVATMHNYRIRIHSVAFQSPDREIQCMAYGPAAGVQIHIAHLMGGGGGHYQPLAAI